jgi:hypothetical protein
MKRSRSEVAPQATILAAIVIIQASDTSQL